MITIKTKSFMIRVRNSKITHATLTYPLPPFTLSLLIKRIFEICHSSCFSYEISMRGMRIYYTEMKGALELLIRIFNILKGL
jgi:hypothetical protein